MTYAEWFIEVCKYFDYFYYVLKRYFCMSAKELQFLSMSEALVLFDQYCKDRDSRDMLNISLHGIDPLKIPYYKNIIIGDADEQIEDCEQYVNLFNTILEKHESKK